MNPDRPVDDGDETKDVLITAPKKEAPKFRYKNIRDHMIEKAGALNGYPFVTISRITKLDPEWETDKFGWSTTTRKLMQGYILRGRGDKDEFIHLFEGTPIGLIVAFPRMPTMAKDGTYNAFDIHGVPMNFINVDEVPLANAEEFKPFIVIRQGRGPDGKMQYGEMQGNPYPMFTPGVARQLAKTIMCVDDNGQPVQTAAETTPTV